MGLRDYSAPTREVAGAAFTVHGLSLDDLSTIVDARRSEVELALASFTEARRRGDTSSAAFVTLLRELPDLAALVIAHGCGEPDVWRQAKLLPFPVAIAALETVLDLTFAGSGGPKKLLESLRTLAAGLGINLPVLATLA